MADLKANQDRTGLDRLDPSTHPSAMPRQSAASSGPGNQLAHSEQDLREAVGAARAAGGSWTAIGAALDISRQAARHIRGFVGCFWADLFTYPEEMALTAASRAVLNGDTWVRSAFAQLSEVPGVHRSGLALAEGGGRRLLFTSSDRDHELGVDWCEVHAYEDVPLNLSVRTGEQVVGSVDDLAGRYPEFVGRQSSSTCALASMPMVAAGHVQGGYLLFYDTPQRFDLRQLTHLRELGTKLGAGLRRAQRATRYANRSLLDEPLPDAAVAATYSVAADPRAVGAARSFIRSTLARWGVDRDTIDTVTLCLSELATNAIIHTDVGCELRVVLDGGVLTTTVRDGGSSLVADLSRVPADPLAVHGRGLQIVSALSSRWGSELDAIGMTVWFVLEPA